MATILLFARSVAWRRPRTRAYLAITACPECREEWGLTRDHTVSSSGVVGGLRCERCGWHGAIRLKGWSPA